MEPKYIYQYNKLRINLSEKQILIFFFTNLEFKKTKNYEYHSFRKHSR